jgi:hypothetical protein
MSKKTIPMLVAVVGFLVLAVVSMLSLGSTAQADTPNDTPTPGTPILDTPTSTPVTPTATPTQVSTTSLDFAFTGLITSGEGKGTVLPGGLVLAAQADGAFTGHFYTANGSKSAVKGKIASNGDIDISFYMSDKGKATIKGHATLNTARRYVGTFKVLHEGDSVASGNWSASPVVDPTKILAFAFSHTARKGSGAHKYDGVLVLDSTTLQGALTLPDGTAYNVAAQLVQGNLSVNITLGTNLNLIGIATPLHGDELKGFTGTYIGPNKGDTGSWSVYAFRA